MIKIVPAILQATLENFEKDIRQVENFAEYVQVDVMDGIFVPNQSFTEIEQINNLGSNLKLELHLMVQHPLRELEKWVKVKNIFRVIFHIESSDDPLAVINYLRGQCWQVGIALNPDTPLTTLEPYFKLIDEVLFMTVYPGQQGAPFVPKVLEKIKQLNSWANKPLIAVDGGVNKDTIPILKEAGVDILCVGSALTLSKNPQKAYTELTQLLN